MLKRLRRVMTRLLTAVWLALTPLAKATFSNVAWLFKLSTSEADDEGDSPKDKGKKKAINTSLKKEDITSHACSCAHGETREANGKGLFVWYHNLKISNHLNLDKKFHTIAIKKKHISKVRRGDCLVQW